MNALARTVDRERQARVRAAKGDRGDALDEAILELIVVRWLLVAAIVVCVAAIIGQAIT